MAGDGIRRGIYPHKLRDQLRKMMMQHYASIVATDETVTTQNFS
jgi:hypothetical protein